MIRISVVTTLCLVLSACAGNVITRDSKDGGPSRSVDMSHVPDAVPRVELRTRAGNKSPYTVLGKTYQLLPDSKGYREKGGASWYGTKFHGRRTSNGEVYDMYAMTAAHKTLPIPAYVKVTNLENGKVVVVRVNDRGPFHEGRIIDLSYAAASKLGFAQQGTAQVLVEAVGPGDQVPSSYGASQSSSSTSVISSQIVTDVSPISTSVTESYELPPNTYLQAGAFSSIQGAETIKQRINQLTDTPVLIVEASKDALYKVRVGPIRDNLQMMRLRELLASNQLPTPHVVYD